MQPLLLLDDFFNGRADCRRLNNYLQMRRTKTSNSDIGINKNQPVLNYAKFACFACCHPCCFDRQRVRAIGALAEWRA